MNEDDNPYRAPEVAIAGVATVARRSRMNLALAMICWLLGLGISIGVVSVVVIVVWLCQRHGSLNVFSDLSVQRALPALAIGPLISISYLFAGRSFWDGRGLRGGFLLLASLSISYLMSLFNSMR